MKKLGFIAITVIAMAGIACDRQKPSPRPPRRNAEVTDTITKIQKVVFTREYSTASPEIMVKLNGVPFNMTWDTGATMTTISALELVNLQKHDKISSIDKVGYVNSEIASGDIHQYPSYCIHELEIPTIDGEPLKVYDVEVAVIDNPTAAMLLGQDVMTKLPRSSVNDRNNYIEFKYDN